MWDAIDCHRCRQLGWIACSWDDPELRFVHLRVMGSSQDNVYTGGCVTAMGSILWVLACLYVCHVGLSDVTSTVFFGWVAMFWGYLKSALKRLPRYRGQGAAKIY